MAITHFNRKLSRLCLYSWRRYARHKIQKKLLKLDHESKSKKMAMFLEAASKELIRDQSITGNIDDEGLIAAENAKINSNKKINTKEV